MITLYILRHGDAGDPLPGPDDDLRELTTKGRNQARTAGRFLKSIGAGVEVVLSSPLPRALQTARLAAAELAEKPEVRVCESLACGARLGDFQSEILRSGCDVVLVVGHQPDLGELIHTLTGAHTVLKKGALARIRCDAVEPGAGLLDWLAPPKLLDAGSLGAS